MVSGGDHVGGRTVVSAHRLRRPGADCIAPVCGPLDDCPNRLVAGGLALFGAARKIGTNGAVEGRTS